MVGQQSVEVYYSIPANLMTTAKTTSAASTMIASGPLAVAFPNSGIVSDRLLLGLQMTHSQVVDRCRRGGRRGVFDNISA